MNADWRQSLEVHLQLGSVHGRQAWIDGNRTSLLRHREGSEVVILIGDVLTEDRKLPASICRLKADAAAKKAEDATIPMF